MPFFYFNVSSGFIWLLGPMEITMLPPYVTKMILVELIPPVIDGIKDGYDYIFGDNPKKNKLDSILITRQDYDFIIAARRLQISEHYSTDEMRKFINKELGLKLSNQSLARIYSKKVNRASLPKRKAK